MLVARGWVAGIVVALSLAGCAGDPYLGKLTGDIKFVNVTPGLATFLAANPTTSALVSVSLYPATGGAPVAYGSHTAVNTAVSATEWKAATYLTQPPVETAGASFLVVNAIRFPGDADYRFGYLAPDAPSSHLSGLVLPQSIAPGGTIKNLEECAVLASVKVVFTQRPADLDALDPATPLECRVSALLEEEVGTSSFSQQAQSGATSYSLAQLRSAAGVTITIPVRADGSNVIYSAACSVVPPVGSGFTLNYMGRAVFDKSSGPTGPLSCGASPALTLDIPVLRPGTPQRRVAFFDGNALQVYRLEDGVLAYPAVTLPNGRGPIRFNSAGSRMVVRAPSELTTLDASNGATLSSQPGKFVAFEFRPGGGGDTAALQEISTNSYILMASIGGVPQVQFLSSAVAAPGETITAPLLTWRPDGAELYVGYGRISATASMVEVLKYPVSATIGTPTLATSAIATSARLYALGFENSGTRVLLGATDGIFAWDLTGAPMAALPSPMRRVDLHAHPLMAFELPAPGDGQVYLANSTVVQREPRLGPVNGFATSRYATDLAVHDVLAVARRTPLLAPGPVRYSVVVYRLNQFGGSALDTHWTFTATDPAFAAFRPHAP